MQLVAQALGISLASEGDPVENLVRALKDRGYSASDIERISGGNFLRIFKQVAG